MATSWHAHPGRRLAVGLVVGLAALVACGEGTPATDRARIVGPATSVAAVTVTRTASAARPTRAPRPEAQVPRPPSPFPLYGVATHLYANIYRQPQIEEHLLGYMRRGTAFRARRTEEWRGCRTGWVELEHGGYVCNGRGTVVSDAPSEVENAPVPPALHDALPYAYGYTVRDNVPQYAVLPTPVMEDEVRAAIRNLRTWEAAQREAATSGAAGSEVPADPTATANLILTRVPGGGFPLPAGAPPLPDTLNAIMLKGFYVSLDGTVAGPSGDRFLRTVRGTYVREDDLIRNDPPTARGVILGGTWQLPIAIAHKKGTQFLRIDEGTGARLGKELLPRHSAHRLVDPEHVFEGHKYVRAADGVLLRPEAVRVIRAAARPPGVPRGARWIHVNLESQSLVAYDGDVPVFATLVSSGKPGFETPTGLYRIQAKFVSATMDDFASPEGAYSIEDVPWTMYFHGNFALHGAFWHYTFGNVRSHGCVNLAPADARWLFGWTGPDLPSEWHTIYADSKRPGTFVYITPATTPPAP